jgi:prepilin-type N-terminal cleavage/methylation domain-containing protein
MIKAPFTFFKRNNPGQSKRGFSLVELLVVLSIFVVMTALILANQNKYTSDSEITDLAYKMALAVRSAQVYGLSVKASSQSSGASGEAQFGEGYGVHFSYATRSTFLLFADSNNNNMYDATANNGSTADIIVTTYSLDKGITIADFCVDGGSYNGTTELCASGKSINTLDISFLRPNPKSTIYAYTGPNPGTQTPQSRAIITLVSPLADKKTKCVVITAAGQITVTNPQSVPNSILNSPYTCEQ